MSSRNVFLDLNALIGCKSHSVALCDARVNPEDRPQYILHVLCDDDARIPDFGARHEHAYEYTDDLPARMKNADGTPRHEFLGVRVYKNQTERDAQVAVLTP